MTNSNEPKSTLKLSKIIDRFQLNVIINKDKVEGRMIKATGIDRVGLELTGQTIYKDLWSIVYFGSKEFNYLKSLDEKTKIERVRNIFSLDPPAVILGGSFLERKCVKKVARECNVPLIETNLSLCELEFTIASYITEKLVHSEMHHGTLISVSGIGVILTGKSGVGKSEAAIELVKKGHMFIADDAVMVSRLGNRLIGRPAHATKNYIEVRGLGILNFVRTFGISSLMTSTQIKLGIELIKVADDEKFPFERLGRKLQYKNIDGIQLPYYSIPVVQGRKIGDIIETAITDFKLKDSGYNSADAFDDQIRRERIK